MRNLLIITAALIAIAALTPAVSADYWAIPAWDGCTDSDLSHPGSSMFDGSLSTYSAKNDTANYYCYFHFAEAGRMIERDYYFGNNLNYCNVMQLAGTNNSDWSGLNPTTHAMSTIERPVSYPGWQNDTDTTHPPTTFQYWQLICEPNSGAPRVWELAFKFAGDHQNYTANFTATPTQGSGPVYVTFTDTSTPGGGKFNWSISPLSGWFVNPSDLDNQDLTVYFTSNGNYTITHGVEWGGTEGGNTSDIETKTDYVWIYNSSATITTPFTAIDLAFAHPITGANISLYDIGNSSWTNGTTGSDGKVSITTLQGHYINGYATAAGYDDADLLGVDAYAGGHTFYMYPQGYTNVSEWNVTVFISVVDDTNFGKALSGVTVTGMAGASQQVGTTDISGIARFVFPNSTNVHFGATKPGYAGTTITLNTGVPSGGSAAVTGTIHMFQGGVTTAPTVTTLPGGGTPTVTQTYLPYCNPGSSDYDQAKCRSSYNEFNLSWMAENAGMLIQLCFIVTVMYLLGVRLGR